MVEGWTPEVPPEPPAGETGKEEDFPAAAAGEPAPGSEETETPPDEGQEDARGANPPSGSLSGEMLTIDFGRLWSTGAGSPPGAPGPPVRVVVQR